MPPEPYDFRKPTPLPVAVRSPLTAWLPKAGQAMAKQWASLFPFAIEVEPVGLEVATAVGALEGVPETASRFRAALQGAAENTLLVVPRPLLLALLSSLLGEAFDPAQPDRDLTPIEQEVSDFVAREHFLGPLAKTWPMTPKLILEAPARLAPGAAPFLAGSLLVVFRFRARGPFGELDWSWMLPRGRWVESLAGGPPPPPAPNREEREELVRELPVRLTVTLGAARLSLVHLAGLQEGDVLVLEQPVDQPLSARLGGQQKFLVWPGAVGSRQAVAIHSPIEP